MKLKQEHDTHAYYRPFIQSVWTSSSLALEDKVDTPCCIIHCTVLTMSLGRAVTIQNVYYTGKLRFSVLDKALSVSADSFACSDSFFECIQHADGTAAQPVGVAGH